MATHFSSRGVIIHLANTFLAIVQRRISQQEAFWAHQEIELAENYCYASSGHSDIIIARNTESSEQRTKLPRATKQYFTQATITILLEELFGAAGMAAATLFRLDTKTLH
eukprot:scaffold350667_cov19-Prasinocladus_malaysianus.AAC.1